MLNIKKFLCHSLFHILKIAQINCISFLTIVILIFAIFTLQLQAQSKWRLPDSPTGKMGSALLDAIEHEDDEFRREFIQTMFTESFLEAFSLEVHLNAFNETHQLLGDFELVGVNKRAPLQAELVLQSKESDRRRKISLSSWA